jgi:hypothetical protein
MTLAERHHLDDVLADLVAHHVLTDDQAHAVVEAWGPETGIEPVAPPVVVAPAAPVPSPVRSRLVEAAAYLGGVLVAGALVAFVADSWDGFTVATRVAVLLGLGVVAGGAGLVLAYAVGDGHRVIRESRAAPRRRAASVLMALGAVLAAASIPVAYDGETLSFFVASLVALALLVPAHLVAASAVTELAMFGASVAAIGTGINLVAPTRPEWDGMGDSPPLWAWDVVGPAVLYVFGLAWAFGVSRLLTLPVVAEVVGLLVALEASIQLAGDRPSRWYGLALLGLLAVAGVGGFILRRTWPWLAASVLSVTVAAFVLASDFENPALPFLVSGVVLLAAAGAGAVLGRRRRAPVA